MILYFSFILVVFIYYMFYIANKNTFQINTNLITPFPVQDGSPNSEPLRVLQLSDLHLEHISISPEKLFQTLKKQRIDLIAITGDFLDRPKSIPKLTSYLRILQQLQPKYGTYAVLGNHDYKLKNMHLKELKRVLKHYDIMLLQNENQQIYVNGVLIHLIGIDDHHSKKHNLKKSFEGITEKDIFRLVLTHDPNVVFQMKDFDFDYLLSGHFHGGQICWPKPYHLRKFGKLVKLNLIKGLIHYDGKVFYINEGLGQTGINIRVGSRPEITIHDIYLPSSRENVLEKVI
ncbi:metallophosphoesterase [Evansella sp. AB-rgal1]|uniref:metallophosphoesterase n=1 Tax=Evansella sp. AB-rgal1 TaxID=3242696 RepID=UPI00359E51E1